MNNIEAAAKYERLNTLRKTTFLLIVGAALPLSLHACQYIQAPNLAGYSGVALVILIVIVFILGILMKPLKRKLNIYEHTLGDNVDRTPIIDTVYGPSDHH